MKFPEIPINSGKYEIDDYLCIDSNARWIYFVLQVTYVYRNFLISHNSYLFIIRFGCSHLQKNNEFYNFNWYDHAPSSYEFCNYPFLKRLHYTSDKQMAFHQYES